MLNLKCCNFWTLVRIFKLQNREVPKILSGIQILWLDCPCPDLTQLTLLFCFILAWSSLKASQLVYYMLVNTALSTDAVCRYFCYHQHLNFCCCKNLPVYIQSTWRICLLFFSHPSSPPQPLWEYYTFRSHVE